MLFVNFFVFKIFIFSKHLAAIKSTKSVKFCLKGWHRTKKLTRHTVGTFFKKSTTILSITGSASCVQRSVHALLGGAGWSNLVGHLSNDHPTYRDDYRMAKGQSDPDTLDMLPALFEGQQVLMDGQVCHRWHNRWVWGGGWHPRAAQLIDTVAAVANVLTSKLLVSYCNNCNNYYCYMPNGNNYLLGLASNKLLPINNLASLVVTIRYLSHHILLSLDL